MNTNNTHHCKLVDSLVVPLQGAPTIRKLEWNWAVNSCDPGYTSSIYIGILGGGGVDPMHHPFSFNLPWKCLRRFFTFYHGIHHFGRRFLLNFFQASWPRKSKEWGDQPDKPPHVEPPGCLVRFRRQILLAPETDSHGLGLAPQCFAEILKREEMKEKTTFFFCWGSFSCGRVWFIYTSSHPKNPDIHMYTVYLCFYIYVDIFILLIGIPFLL